MYPPNPTDADFDAHQLYDEFGNERTDEDFSKHGGYHDDYVMVEKETTQTVCSVCGAEQ